MNFGVIGPATPSSLPLQVYTNPQDMFGRRHAFDGMTPQANGLVFASEYAVTGERQLGFCSSEQHAQTALACLILQVLSPQQRTPWPCLPAEGGGNGNLIGAVAEAAFMLGMERNSGTESGSGVVLAGAYAPLLVNANAVPWPTNMIVFDSHR